MKLPIIAFVATFAIMFAKNFLGQELPPGMIWENVVSNGLMMDLMAQAIGGALIVALVVWVIFRKVGHKSKA